MSNIVQKNSTNPLTFYSGSFLADNLWKIAGRVYGKSSLDVISYIVDANKDTIKDRDVLSEGQIILIPSLPAYMLNRTTAAAQGGKGSRTAPDVPPFGRNRTLTR